MLRNEPFRHHQNLRSEAVQLAKEMRRSFCVTCTAVYHGEIGEDSLVLQKSIIFAANIFAIAAKNIGLFGTTFLEDVGKLLLAIPNKLHYHLATHASERIAKWQKRILSKSNDIGTGSVRLWLL
jgi:hypothetical protein